MVSKDAIRFQSNGKCDTFSLFEIVIHHFITMKPTNVL